MNIYYSKSDGKLYINDREVKNVKFTDGGKLKFPFIDDTNESLSAIIEEKNTIKGSAITVGGDFHLGDK